MEAPEELELAEDSAEMKLELAGRWDMKDVRDVNELRRGVLWGWDFRRVETLEKTSAYVLRKGTIAVVKIAFSFQSFGSFRMTQ